MSQIPLQNFPVYFMFYGDKKTFLKFHKHRFEFTLVKFIKVLQA